MAQKIRSVFCYTESRVAAERIKSGNKRLRDIPEHEKEFLAIYSTPVQKTIMVDFIVNSEFQEETKELSALGEIAAERILDGTNPNADILLKTHICKIRKLTKTILTDLKIAYGYRCQICGEYIGEKYGSNLIHAHHIDYFTKSANNNMNNIKELSRGSVSGIRVEGGHVLDLSFEDGKITSCCITIGYEGKAKIAGFGKDGGVLTVEAELNSKKVVCSG